MKFQADRARELYREAMRSLPEADRRAQRPGLMMAAIYHALLDEIERDNWQVLHQRISLTPCASSGWPGKPGWAAAADWSAGWRGEGRGHRRGLPAWPPPWRCARPAPRSLSSKPATRPADARGASSTANSTRRWTTASTCCPAPTATRWR